MIKTIKRTGQFKKDYKKAIKQGCKEEDFREVLKYLVEQKPLPEKYQDHHRKEKEMTVKRQFYICIRLWLRSKDIIALTRLHLYSG